MMNKKISGKGAASRLRPQITCPHCWTIFPVENILWVAGAPELLADSRLGESEKQRFLPIQFDIRGNAIDLKGFSCEKLACPYCHLYVPRPLLEMPPYFTSIVGAPASGKSYFLTSMIWALRKTLPQCFGTSFSDSDPGLNAKLHEYEAIHFMNDNPDLTAKIEKTAETGDLYNTVLINNQHITYLQPFLFSLIQDQTENKAERNSLALAVYDNAGESFLPVQGRDTISLPVTRHLAKSHSVFFTFDPLQDNRFRALCSNSRNDPQLMKETQDAFKKSPMRQEMVLGEMIKRIRDYYGLRFDEKYDRPVIIVLTKLDAWRDLLPNYRFDSPWKVTDNDRAILALKPIKDVSEMIRNLLRKHIPEMVSMLDQFASDVTFIPVSATGSPPVRDEQTGEWGFRMKDIQPVWIEVPLLYALSKTTHHLIPKQ